MRKAWSWGLAALFGVLPAFFVGACDLSQSGQRLADDAGVDVVGVDVVGVDVDAEPPIGDSGPDVPLDAAPEAGPLSPADVPGIFMWLRADKNVVIGDGGADPDAGVDSGTSHITAWNDSSGASDVARNATAPNPPSMPSFIANDPAFKGQPVVRFSDYTRLITGSINIVQPATVFLVGAASSAGPSNKFFMDSNSTAGQFAVLCTPADNVQVSAGVLTTLGTPLVTSPRVIVTNFNGLNSRIFVSAKTPLSGNAGGGGATGITLGNYADGTIYALKGPIAEFALWKRQLTSLEIYQLELYAADRYGLVISP